MHILANREDPDEMLHHATFHQGLHCLLFTKISCTGPLFIQHKIMYIFFFSDIVLFQPKRLQNKFEDSVQKYSDDVTVYKLKSWLQAQR